MTSKTDGVVQVGRIGAELELLCVRDGQPIPNLNRLLPNEGDFGSAGSVTTDAGIGWGELVTRPCRSVAEVARALRELLARLPPEWGVEFTPYNHYLEDVPPEDRWNDKSRYRTLRKALERDSPNGWRKIDEMPLWGATHFTMEISPISVEGLNLMNFLNHIAPYFTYVMCEELGIENSGHHLTWTEFARPERLPSYRWFGTPGELILFFESIPRLMRSTEGKEGNGWEVDLQSFQVMGDPGDETVFWKLCRPKLQHRMNGCPGCIEFRPLPTMTVEQVEFAGGIVLGLANEFLLATHGASLPTPESLDPVLRELSTNREFGRFVPERPQTEAEWTTYFCI